MNTQTMSHAFAAGHASADTTRPVRAPFFQRMLATLIKGQEMRARKIVYAHLAHQDDATLARLGWSPADIAKVRKAPVAAALPL